MKNLILVFLLAMTGCQSLGSDFVEGVEEKVRLRWAEEWKPTLTLELENAITKGKESTINEVLSKLEIHKTENNAKLENIGVKVENFDTNNDGRVTGMESVALLKEIKAKNKAAGSPLSLWEIIVALAAAYVPLTGAKELARKKLNGIGNDQKLS
jgi:hypothetical protein